MPGTTQWEDPVPYLTTKYELDFLPSKNYVWKQQTDRNRSYSSESLAEEILKWHLDNGGTPHGSSLKARHILLPSSKTLGRTFRKGWEADLDHLV